MKAKAAVIDHKVGPDFCDHESDKNVESAAAKPNPNAVFFPGVALRWIGERGRSKSRPEKQAL
jgi:hypothetical protein